MLDPTTGESAGEAPQADEADVAAAVAAAVTGFAAWRATNPWERADALRRIARAIAARREEIALCMAQEIGKPIAQGRGEVQVAIDQFDWYADETRRIYGQIVEARTSRLEHLVRFEPVGIVAAFAPWNFPVALVARKVAPALGAGCAVIVRPADEAPATVAALFECIEAGGLPAGSVNLLNGKPEKVTPALLAHPEVRKVSFTGSVPIGRLIARLSAETLKKVTMELGGHAPVIVFDDADPVAVAKQSVAAKYRNCGQICVSPTRFYVQRSSERSFSEAFVELASRIRVGAPTDPSTEMGPLATSRRRDQLESLISDAMDRGARCLTGGRRMPGSGGGFYFEPTVLADVPEDARVMREEPFGPLAVINPFDSPDQAYARANASSFGLAAYAFTRDLARAHEAAERLEAGVVSINTFAASTTEIPFGGIKDSGYGRECGSLGLHEYLEAKTVNIAY